MSQQKFENRFNNQQKQNSKVFKIYYKNIIEFDIPQSIVLFNLDFEEAISKLIEKLDTHMKENMGFPAEFKLDRQLAEKFFLIRGIDTCANETNLFEYSFSSDQLKQIINSETCGDLIEIVDILQFSQLSNSVIKAKFNETKYKNYGFIKTKNLPCFIKLNWLNNQENNKFFLRAPKEFKNSTTKYIVVEDIIMSQSFISNIHKEFAKIILLNDKSFVLQERMIDPLIKVMNVSKARDNISIDSTLVSLLNTKEWKYFDDDDSNNLMKLIPYKMNEYRNFKIETIVDGQWENKNQPNRPAHGLENISELILKMKTLLTVIDSLIKNDEIAIKNLCFMYKVKNLENYVEGFFISDPRYSSCKNLDDPISKYLKIQSILEQDLKYYEDEHERINQFMTIPQLFYAEFQFYMVDNKCSEPPRIFLEKLYSTGYRCDNKPSINNFGSLPVINQSLLDFSAY